MIHLPCKIWGFHGGDYDEWCILGCYAVWLLQVPHGVTTQNTPFFIVTAVKTSNLTYKILLKHLKGNSDWEMYL
jgi:hypothetical protein